ncbi:porin [Labrys sp. ZIDIC5]|uniref:porin n=2 Tax=Labrys TaxID=204476 RepID=UPI002ACA072F|nr:porin [Labrys sp. ZIDIC5]MDZ5448139.1 porin [Labrys sp. ZIDIC5]
MSIRAILLGAGAGFLGIAAASAADLPMSKGEAVEYVKVCTAFGPGFFYIPGTDTCLKISGQIRADYWFAQAPSNATGKRNISQTQFRTNARIRFDARTQTDWGMLRSFFELQAESNAGAATHDTFQVRQAYLQFGGLTAGYAWSPYAFYDPNYQAEFFAPYFGEQGRRNLISYTAQFDKAYATLSIEDGRDHRANASVYGNNVVVNGVTVAGGVGGAQMPDIVGVVGYDDNKNGWGRFQVMGALHQNRSATAGYSTKYGYSIGVGGNVNLPVLEGAYIAAEASYADGAVKYLGVGGSQPNGSSTLGFGGVDAYITNGTIHDLDSAKGFAVQGEAGLNVTKNLQAILFGGYLHFDAPRIASNITDNFNYYVVGGQVNYTVVKGFIAGAEVWYQNKDPEGLNSKTVDAVGAGVRLRRTF